MGETRDWLEAEGGPGRILCKRTGYWEAVRCDDADSCGQCIGEQPEGCEACALDCPEWVPDPEEDPRGERT